MTDAEGKAIKKSVIIDTGIVTYVKSTMKDKPLITLIADSYTCLIKDHDKDAQFDSPEGIAVDRAGNLYIAEPMHNSIRKIGRDGRVSTLAGWGERGYKDGVGAEVKFNKPCSVAVDINGNVFVADTGNNLIRKIDISGRGLRLQFDE